MAAVTVRAFGALRELVGEPHAVDADHVAGLLDDLATRHGGEFVRRMARATIAVDEETVPADDTNPLRDGATVLLLPPFAGG